MEKRILVPIDFSEISKDVVHFACNWSKKRGGELIFVHVAMPLGYPSYSGEIIEFPEEKTILQKLLNFLQPLDVNVQHQTLALFGIPYLEILEKHRSLDIDLILMAAHSHTLLGRIFLGGNTDYVMHHSNCPLYIFRKEMNPTQNRIIVPLDYSEVNIKVAEFADQWALENNSELYFIHVATRNELIKGYQPEEWGLEGENSSTFHENINKDDISIHEKALHDYVRFLKIKSKHQLVLRFGKPYIEILKLKKEIDAKLIMMASHSHSFVGRILAGTNTDYLLNHSDCPMYVYKEKKKAKK